MADLLDTNVDQNDLREIAGWLPLRPRKQIAMAVQTLRVPALQRQQQQPQAHQHHHQYHHQQLPLQQAGAFTLDRGAALERADALRPAVRRLFIWGKKGGGHAMDVLCLLSTLHGRIYKDSRTAERASADQ